MIRRDATTAAGSPAWVLISQVDHARFAGQLATDWISGDAVLGAQRGVIVPTVFRHDDGWHEWERAPTIDPDSGQPRSFLEMPAAEAHEIWRRSIDGVADLGPLAQFMVAEHFCRLRRAAGLANDPAVRDFLDEFDGRCRRWLAVWRSLDAVRNTPAAATRAVEWLQFFDVFSLWLCMAERTTPHELFCPDHVKLTLQPMMLDGDEQQIAVQPWPWSSPLLALHVAGRLLAQTKFSDNAALQAGLASAPRVGLNWTLAPC